MYEAKMSYMEKVDRYIDSLKVGKSALVDSWFMMSSPVPIFSIVVTYLLIVRIGPRVMKNRPPLGITKIITYYNALQVIFSVWLCAKAMKLNLFRDGFVHAGCRYPSSTQNLMLLDLGWWYFFAKFIELLDTVFFVLRKKNKQVTFLHVYHHATMVLYAWSYLKFAAGGQGAMLALLNSIIHVVMYAYYLLAGLGPRFQKYLWWKKYVTTMQLVQFVIMLVYCAWTHFSPRCQYSNAFTYFISGNVTIYLLLFLNFYTKNYKKKKIEKIEEEYGQIPNGIKKNGICESVNGKISNGVTDIHCVNKENGVCVKSCQNTANLEDTSCEVNKSVGDFTKNGNVFLTRRTAKAAFGSQCEFGSIIKK